MNGHSRSGNTLPRIIRNEEIKPTPTCGCMTGTTSGTRKAVTRFIRMVYEVRCAALPPSFPVTTAAAVAVGQIRHNIAPSTNILECISGNIYRTPARRINEILCMRSNTICHLHGLSSLISTLQKVRKSIMKISIGWTTATACSTNGFVGSRNGIFT